VTIEIEIAVEAPAWINLLDAKVTLRRAIEEAIADAGLAETELGVVLTDDAHIRALNRAWRGADEATNVLSFPVPAGPATGPRLLGDLCSPSKR
jgi:probable rRNA maturation factor